MTSLTSRDEIKNRVREASDIVQLIGESVELKKAGSRYSGLCPFHAEKTPSFSVNPQGQFFHCFGCGESGDIFSFIMKYHRLSFPEALKELAKRYQIDLPEQQLSEADKKKIKERELLYLVNQSAAEIYHTYLLKEKKSEKARIYLKERGVSAEMIEKYHLGYAPDPKDGGWTFVTNILQRKQYAVQAIEKAGLGVKKDQGGYYDRFRDRVLFPIVGMTGRTVAFGGRILGEGNPKYMNSPESPIFDKSRTLFGLFQHKEAIRKDRKAIVVEGNFDLLLLAAHGIENVVAPLGTSLTHNHIRLLKGFCDEVILLFDGDSAGLKAAMRSVPLFLSEQVDARVALLPQEHDPDSLVREKGPEGIYALVDEAQSLAEFVFDSYVKKHGVSLEGKNKIVGELQELINSATDPSQRSLMTAHFSEKLGIHSSQFRLKKQVNKSKKSLEVGQEPKSLNDLPRMQRQLVDFLILYPEFLHELLAAGLEKTIREPIVMEIVDCLKQTTVDGDATPDMLLSTLTGESERNYVAKLLMRATEENGDDDAEQEQLMYREILTWLHYTHNRQSGADLQKRIDKAQKAGDIALLMELIKEKQEIGKKISNLNISY